MIVILNRHINNLPYPKGKEIGRHRQPYLQKSHNFGQNLEILAIVFVDLRYRLSANSVPSNEPIFEAAAPFGSIYCHSIPKGQRNWPK